MTKKPPVCQRQNSILEKRNKKIKKWKNKKTILQLTRAYMMCPFGKDYFCQLILLFSLFLLLFMGLTALFGTIHGSHYTILANYYIYLQYFQQKNFQFQQNKKIPNGSDIDYLTAIETLKHKQPLSEEKWISDKIVSHMGLVVHYLDNLTRNFQYKLYKDHDDDDELLNSCSWHVCYQRFWCCNLLSLSPSAISLSPSRSLTLSFPLFLILGFSDLLGGVGLRLQFCFQFLYFYFN